MNKTLSGNLRDTVRRYWLRISIAFLMVVISNGLLVLNPLIFRQAIMAIQPSADHFEQTAPFFRALFGSWTQSVYAWGGLLFIISIISALLKYLMRLMFITISREEEKEIRQKLFERIQLQGKAFFDRHEIGDLISRLTSDITAYRDVLGPGLMFPAFFITLVTPSLIALFYLSPLMAALSTIPIMLIYGLNIGIRQPMFKISQKVQQFLARMSAMAHEHYSGIRMIKSYGVERQTARLFQQTCQQFNWLDMKFACLQGIIYPILSLITRVVTLSLVLLAAAIIWYKWEIMSEADFLSFMWIQSYLFGPLLMLGWVLPMYQKGRAAYQRLVDIYEEPLDLQDNPSSTLSIPSHPSITIKNLTFNYPTQSQPSLQAINLFIPGGTFVGLTGPVGAGKTTLFRLLNREYEVPEGKIYIGEHEIHHYSLYDFHQEVVTVEQLPFLFSKTIRENVRFARQEATQEELEKVIKQVDLYETILDLPAQYDTVVGERGVSLSGGQKQRVAMARAFLVNHSILLLDDIFSAVDAATAKTIFNQMKENFKGKTVLLISHHVSILDQLDRVVYLFNGQILEDGNPKELGQQNGPYAALKDLQKMHVL